MNRVPCDMCGNAQVPEPEKPFHVAVCSVCHRRYGANLMANLPAEVVEAKCAALREAGGFDLSGVAERAKGAAE